MPRTYGSEEDNANCPTLGPNEFTYDSTTFRVTELYNLKYSLSGTVY